MPEIYYELPSADDTPSLLELGPSVRSSPIKYVSLATLAAGALAYAHPPRPDDWQKWLNKAVRHWLWHEMRRKRRHHYPSGYADSSQGPIH